MFCYRCGKQMEDGMVFCRFCGARVDQIEDFAMQEQPGAPALAQSAHTQAGTAGDAQTNAQTQADAQPQSMEPASAQHNQQPQEKRIMGYTVSQWKRMPYWEKIRVCDKPMRWFIVLPILMAAGACSSVLYFVNASSAISLSSSTSLLDSIVQLISMGLNVAVFILLWRFNKAGFVLLFVLYGIEIVYALITLLNMPSYLAFELAVAQTIGQVFVMIGACVYLVVTIFYYRKRRHLLVG